jgi:hypothetical protein
LVFTFLIAFVSGLLLWLVIPNSTISAFSGISRAGWLTFHAGSGFSGLLGVIIHIGWHWDWLKALRGRSLCTLKKPVRANRVINRLTWFAFLSSTIFGMLAWLLSASMPIEAIRLFDRLHTATSITCMVLVATHLVLHQKWINLATQRFLPYSLAANGKFNKEHQT